MKYTNESSRAEWNNTSLNNQALLTRRDLLKKLPLAMVAVNSTGERRARGVRVPDPSDYGLMDALEEHGQWASSVLWAYDIHRTMGGRVVRLLRQFARGPDAIPPATSLAMQRFHPCSKPPSGAVVIVCSAPGPQHIRCAHTAYTLVRDHLPLNAYCAYSPLVLDLAFSEVVVLVALAWR